MNIDNELGAVIVPQPLEVERYASKWLLSFNDLLTLLLCFFISTATLGPLGQKSPQQKLHSIKGVSPTALVLDKIPGILDPGTQIAQYSPKSSLVATAKASFREFWLRESDFQSAGPTLSVQAHNSLETKLKSLLSESRFKLWKVQIETCKQGSDVSDGQAWSVSIERALALRSQLIDAGIVTPQLRIRVLGAMCKLISTDEPLAVRLLVQLE